MIISHYKLCIFSTKKGLVLNKGTPHKWVVWEPLPNSTTAINLPPALSPPTLTTATLARKYDRKYHCKNGPITIRKGITRNTVHFINTLFRGQNQFKLKIWLLSWMLQQELSFKFQVQGYPTSKDFA